MRLRFHDDKLRVREVAQACDAEVEYQRSELRPWACIVRILDYEEVLVRKGLVCALLMGSWGVMAADGPTAQIDRGRDLFLHSSKGLACATCHSLEGKGTAVGPDLRRLASVVGPRGLLMTIQMSMTAYVQQIELKNGRSFPGIQKEKDGDMLTIFDLSQTPAVERKVKSGDVASMKPNTKWMHPPASANYSDPELADLIAYLKFVGTGVVKDVAPSELR